MLQLHDVTKNFGGLCVLMGVSFVLNEGEIVGLIGPNGAGKTTLFNLITGIHQPSEGSIRFAGRSLVGLKPHRICHRGIARTFQLVRVFPSMTVRENVLVGATYGTNGHARSAKSHAADCIEMLNLSHLGDTPVGSLPYPERKLVEIARALAAKPGLLLLDEPLSGLNPAETQRLMGLIRQIRDERGISIMWVEHKIEAIFSVCDRILVLDYGEKIAEGAPREVAANARVVEAYLGEPHA